MSSLQRLSRCKCDDNNCLMARRCRRQVRPRCRAARLSIPCAIVTALLVSHLRQSARHLRVVQDSLVVADAASISIGSNIVWVNSSQQNGDSDSPTSTAWTNSNTTSRFDMDDVAAAALTGVARFANGTLGYIADPAALRLEMSTLLRERYNTDNPLDSHSYWAIQEWYGSRYTYHQSLRLHPDVDSMNTTVSASSTVPFSDVQLATDTVCADAPGMGLEGGMGAYKLLTEKIRVSSSTPLNDSVKPTTVRPIKVLCAMYTHAPTMFTLARTAALTWGVQCDGFVAFSNVTVAALGMVDLHHIGPQSYHNMWQKTRSIWRYIYLHYLNDFDYFHLSGDDVYVIVPNLRRFLQAQHERRQREQNTSHPDLYAGQWVRQKHRPYMAGGPGYTLSRQTLRRYMQSGVWETCQSTTIASYEDRLLSQCLSKLLTMQSDTKFGSHGNNSSLASLVDFWTDTREEATGAQQFHDTAPQQVHDGRPPQPRQRRRPSFHSRQVAYHESLPLPYRHVHLMRDDNETVLSAGLSRHSPWVPAVPPLAAVGPRYGLDAAGTYSVAFHHIRHPLFMARIHALLYPDLCPDTSTLGQSRNRLRESNVPASEMETEEAAPPFLG